MTSAVFENEFAHAALKASKLGAWRVLIPGPAHWDQRTRELHGADPHISIDAQMARNYVHPDDREALDRAVMNCMDSGSGHYEAEYRVNSPIAEQRWIKVLAQVIEKDGRMIGFLGTVQDITAAKHDEHVRNILVTETLHRTKNIIGIINSIARRTFKNAGVPEELLESFHGRLHALARSQEALNHANNAAHADLCALVGNCIDPFVYTDAERIITQGPSVNLDARIAGPFCLILHELLTNAVKYGALSVEAGTVHIAWTVEITSHGQMLRLTWQERGGPPVEVPKRRGFGTMLVSEILKHSYQRKADARLRFEQTGVTCELDVVL